ncbi:hypothetical protein RJ639_046314 [Escallonia herrerae]|uniref:Reverse transcriptase/retrotransposon-derived protein RNase H-like domain-containing protein n=1 Tax=Escallonia herrerae TaxID=1293975 RepID=A0AA88W7D8_9ASTE|nr:hypothetical protein RJ639_046314 [Escallonia herrerae]
MPIATITFSDEDSKDVKTPHDDPLVIMIRAGNFDVKRVLVDNGSSAEVLFYEAFKKMNIPTDRLQKLDTPLYGFSNHPVAVEGIITLSVAIGTPPTQANFMLDFVVVKVPSSYHAILGQPALNQLQAVVSTYHLKMKFPTEHGIGEVKEDQTTVHGRLSEIVRRTQTYLSSPPLLLKPLPGEDLFLYLSVTEVAVSAVLVSEDDGLQKPIYYVSKVLQDVETRYLKIDKVALALIISARRLRPYFQSHTIVILTDQPLRKVLLSPEASGRLSNGQTKNMNRSILQGLKKKLDEAKGAWVDELPKVLWAYRTTPHSVTGETPFLLYYGTKAMLPVEIGVPTIRALHFNKEINEVGLRANLDLVEEARTQAHERSIVIKQRVARYYNQRVRSKQFKEGDLVLHKLEVSDPKAATGKLSPNWEGPYRVIKVLKPGAYTLGTLSGELIPHTWNAENLQKYY